MLPKDFINLNLNNSSQSRNCDITGTSQVSALSNDSYGRVLGCTFSLLLKACTVAADVEFSGSLFHCGMVFATKYELLSDTTECRIGLDHTVLLSSRSTRIIDGK